MPSCHFVHLILLSSGPKVPKSGPFKNEGIHELVDASEQTLDSLPGWARADIGSPVLPVEPADRVAEEREVVLRQPSNPGLGLVPIGRYFLSARRCGHADRHGAVLAPPIRRNPASEGAKRVITGSGMGMVLRRAAAFRFKSCESGHRPVWGPVQELQGNRRRTVTIRWSRRRVPGGTHDAD